MKNPFSKPHLIILVLVTLFLVLLVAPASGDADGPGGQGANRVSVIINFEHQPGPAEAAQVKALGGDVQHVYGIVPAILATIPEPAIIALSANPKVTLVEPDQPVHLQDAELDNAWSVKHIGAGSVHNSGNKGAGVRIAIIDSGIDTDHPDLNYDPDCSVNLSTENIGVEDGHSHGTHVAGSIAALDNGLGVVGVAPEATLCIIKVFDSNGNTTWAKVVQGLDFIATYNDNHPNDPILVTNNSIGDDKSTEIMALEPAYNNLYDNYGVVNVAAAGNLILFNNGCYIPAIYNSVIAVGGTTSSDTRWFGSLTCPELELAAPAASVYSTWNNGSYGTKSGTSMASPHVAGTAALIISAGITDSNGNGYINDEVRQRLIDTAVDLGSAGRDTSFGYGRVDAAAAAQSNNTQPTANDLNDSTAEDTLDTWFPDVGDVDVGDTLTCNAGPASSNGGVVTVMSDCSSGTYDPPTNYNGPDSFTYFVSDGALSDSATVSYQVSAVNDQPTANDVNGTTAEDTLDTWFPDVGDVDIGDILTCSVGPASSNGGVVTIMSDCTSGTYDPPANYNGSDSFTYSVSDGEFSDSATVNYQVTAVNTRPIANDVSGSTAEDTLDTWYPNVNDVDIGDTLTCTADGSSSNGGVVTVMGDCSGGTYDPPTNYNGPDSFTYFVSDGALSDSATVSYQVNAVNDQPLANDVSASTAEDMLATWFPDVSDVDLGDTLTCTADAVSSNGGAVTVNADCSNGDYNPPPGFTGQDSFNYSVSDSLLNDSATVTIDVVGAVDSTANSEPFSDGTVTGTYVDTWADDDVVETITESHSGGKKSARFDYVNHKWKFDVSIGSPLTLNMNAWVSTVGEDGQFAFFYSDVDGSYLPLDTINSISQDNYQSVPMLPSTTGEIYILMTDVDQTPGSSDLDTISIDEMYIRVGSSSGNMLPMANFLIDVTDLDVTFTDTSVDPDGSIFSWQWDFGDSNSSSAQNPMHRYNQSGMYNVTLTVTDDRGAENTKTQSVTASAPDVVVSIHVDSISLSTVSGDKGNKFGQATVVVVDNLGNFLGGVTVDGTFSGDYNEPQNGDTDSSGSIVFITATQVKRPSFGFCVDSLSDGSLPYNPADNTITCATY